MMIKNQRINNVSPSSKVRDNGSFLIILSNICICFSLQIYLSESALIHISSSHAVIYDSVKDFPSKETVF